MGACGSKAATVAPAPAAPLPRFILSDPASLTPAQLDSVTSCFTLLVLVPPHAAAHGLARGRHARGHAFRIGGRESIRADPEGVTHWRAVEATSARALLIFSHRGGLEMPGGGRNRDAASKRFTEGLCAAAARELAEETGVQLSRPLEDADAVLTAVERATGSARWQLYLRVVRSSAEFYSAAWGQQPKEMWGCVGVPLACEDLHLGARANGFPRALAGMPPWQAELLLPVLVAGGVLTGEEALLSAEAADAFVAAGGMQRGAGSAAPPAGAAPGSLELALRAALADLARHACPPQPRCFAPVLEAGEGGGCGAAPPSGTAAAPDAPAGGGGAQGARWRQRPGPCRQQPQLQGGQRLPCPRPRRQGMPRLILELSRWRRRGRWLKLFGGQ